MLEERQVLTQKPVPRINGTHTYLKKYKLEAFQIILYQA
jgi:hypothetical protein